MRPRIIYSTSPTPVVSIHASVKDATSSSTYIGIAVTGFNPRICKRCDVTTINTAIVDEVSIHASVKDATRAYPKQIK